MEKILLVIAMIALVALVLLIVVALGFFVAALAREREWKDMVDDEYYRINDGKEKNQ